MEQLVQSWQNRNDVQQSFREKQVNTYMLRLFINFSIWFSLYINSRNKFVLIMVNNYKNPEFQLFPCKTITFYDTVEQNLSSLSAGC